MTIRVTEVALSDTPRHVFGGTGDLDVVCGGKLVNGVDVFDPDRQPDAFIQTVIAFGLKGRGIGAFAAAALAVEAQKYFTLAGSDAAKIHGFTPFPILGPTEFFEPGKRRMYVRNIENRSDVSDVHRRAFLRGYLSSSSRTMKLMTWRDRRSCLHP